LVYVQRGKGTYISADVRPDERERPHLAREVAKRALREARRSGLELEDLIEAFKEMAERREVDAKEGGAG